jgi:mono/diheme cytochrome c family protein
MRGDAWSERRRRWWFGRAAAPMVVVAVLLGSVAAMASAYLVGLQGVRIGRVTPTASTPQPIPPPPAVKRAGGRELREFKAGAKVVEQSGCVACHRIGAQGRSGPGPALTHIGSKLAARAIERALLRPSAPMPSFSHLPKRKLKAVVRFLSLLR